MVLAEEVLAQVPIPAHVVQEYWVDVWCTGAAHIDFDVSCLLLDKSDSFDVDKGVPTLKTD